jgi:uncharacterized protein YjbI with pentapeptide repeats
MKLEGAILERANLTGAHLNGAYLHKGKLPRDNRGETLATIRVRKCRWWADGGRA